MYKPRQSTTVTVRRLVLDRLSSLSALQVRTISVLTVIVVAIADYLTGVTISFSVFYFIPIVFASWYERKDFAWVLALVSALCWFAADTLSGAQIPLLIHVWNASSRLVTFAGVVWLLTWVRREKLSRLQAQLARYSRIMETAIEGVLALDRTGCIQHVNSQAAYLLGYDPLDLLGTHYSHLVRDDASRSLIEETQRTGHDGVPQKAEIQFIRKDGSPLWTLANIGSTYDAQKNPDGTILLVTDISERRKAEGDLRRQYEEIVAMQNLSLVLARSLNLKQRLEGALQTVLNATRFDAGAIYLRDEGGTELVLQHSVGFRTRTLALASRWEVGRGITGCVCQTGEPQFVEDALESDLADPALRTEEDIRGFAAIPLVSKEAVLGVVCIIRREPYLFSMSEKSMLMTFGSQIGVALENARLYEDARTREQQVRQLSINLMRIQEEERKKFARELHEGLAQLLTMMRVNAELALENLGKTVESTRQRILEVIGLVGEAENEAKQISHDLRPAILDDFGLKAAIEVLARNFQRRTGVAVDLHLPVSDVRFDSVIETTVYRIVQELLTNVAKHANATRVTIQVLVRGRILALTVADNGIGFNADKVLIHTADGTHNGLHNMRERAESVRGMFHVESAPGKGTEFSIEIPCILGEDEPVGQEPHAR